MSQKIWTDEKYIEAVKLFRVMLAKGHTMNDCFRAVNLQQALFYPWKKAHPEHFIDFPKPVYRNGSKRKFDGVMIYDGRVRKII